MLRISWTEHVSNDELIETTKMTFILNIRKWQLKFLISLENLTLTEYIEDKTASGKQRATQLASLNEWVTEQGLGEMVKTKVIKSYKAQ